MTVTEMMPLQDMVGRTFDVVLSSVTKLIPFVYRKVEVRVDAKHFVQAEGLFLRISKNDGKGLKISVSWEKGPSVLLIIRGVLLHVRAFGETSADIIINGAKDVVEE
jgi:hypothetical protein